MTELYDDEVPRGDGVDDGVKASFICVRPSGSTTNRVVDDSEVKVLSDILTPTCIVNFSNNVKEGVIAALTVGPRTSATVSHGRVPSEVDGLSRRQASDRSHGQSYNCGRVWHVVLIPKVGLRKRSCECQHIYESHHGRRPAARFKSTGQKAFEPVKY